MPDEETHHELRHDHELRPLPHPAHATMEISRRHGLSSVASTIAALPGPQYLTEIARLHRFINIANDRRHSQAVDPNAFFDLEPEYLGLHPIPEPADFTYPQPGGAPPVDLTTPADSGCRPCRGSRFTTLVRFTTQSVLPELLAQAELTSEANELRSNPALGWADLQLMLKQIARIDRKALWDRSYPLPTPAQHAARITAQHAFEAAWHVLYAYNAVLPKETTSKDILSAFNDGVAIGTTITTEALDLAAVQGIPRHDQALASLPPACVHI